MSKSTVTELNITSDINAWAPTGAANRKTVTKDLLAKSAEGFPLLGQVVYWTISDFKIGYWDFIKILQEVGIDTDVANAVQAKSALIKALKDEIKERSNGAFHRNVVDNKEKAGFALVSTHSVDAENVDVNFQTETKVILDKQTKSLRVEGTNAQAIQDKYQDYRNTYTADRFRNVVLKVIFGLAEGIAVRERGGVYFIPAHKQEVFEKLQQLFSHFPGCSLDVLPVIDTKQARGSMWKSFVGDIKDEIASFKEDVESLKSKNSARESTLDTRLKRYRALKEKMENYEILFGGTLNEIKAEVGDLETQIRSMLAE